MGVVLEKALDLNIQGQQIGMCDMCVSKGLLSEHDLMKLHNKQLFPLHQRYDLGS